MAITSHLHSTILLTLTKRKFQPEDWIFDSKFDSKQGATFLSITYAYRPTFIFQARIPKEKKVGTSKYTTESFDFHIGVSYSPGEATVNESAAAFGVDEMIKLIDSWTVRIHNELEAGPLARAVAEQQAKIEEIMGRLGDVEKVGEDHFTRAEADAFLERIAKLEADLIGAIEQHESDAKVQQAEIDTIHRDMAELRVAAKTMNKRGVMRKVAAWAAGVATPVVVKMLGVGGIEVVHRLLPPP